MEVRSKAHSFEDLKIWKMARELVRSVYMLTNSSRFNADIGLREQVRRAAGSSMANIAEGFERGSAGSSSGFYSWPGVQRVK